MAKKRRWSDLPGWVRAKIIKTREAAIDAALGLEFGSGVSAREKRETRLWAARIRDSETKV